MNIFQAIVLGIVQGIAEFLPISSSGHLVLFQTFLGIEQPSFFYDVLLHVATLVPIFIVFRKDILELIKNPFQKTTYLLVIATIPTILFVLLFGDFTDKLYSNGLFLPFSFALTGCFLLYADKTAKKDIKGKKVGYIDAVIIGCMQSLGTLPGVSRSGSTLTGALASGVDRDEAAKFSFLMAVPAILGALFLQIIDLLKGDVVIVQESVVPMLLGCIAAMVAGYLSINFLLALIRKAKLKFFAYYVFVLSVFVLFCQLFLNMKFVIAA